jgi:hypothetical protein
MIYSLEARARRLLATPAAHAPSILVPWNCGALVRPFAVQGELQGSTLHLVGNRFVASGGPSAAGPAPVPAAFGSFAIDVSGWAGCPHCLTKPNRLAKPFGFWRCEACGTFNCPGDRGGLYTCACGTIVTRDLFVAKHTFEVCGARAEPARPHMPQPPVAGVIIPSPPHAPAIPHRVSTPQLSGPPALRLPGKK